MQRLRRLLSTIFVAGLLVGPVTAQLYQTDFTTSAGWLLDNAQSCNSTQTYGWAVDATPATHPAGASRSAPASLNFNDGLRVGPAFGGTACGSATSPPIDLAHALSDPFVEFWFSYQFNQGSGCTLDPVRFQVSNDSFASLLVNECLPAPGQSFRDWHRMEFGLQRNWGTVELRFQFFGGPQVGFNDPSGPFIDDLVVDALCKAPTVYCPSAPNSQSATGARIGLIGTPSVNANNFRLYATDTPPGTFAVAIYGDQQSAVPSGAGTLCVIGGNFYRLAVVPTGTAGTPSWLVDLSAPPQPSGLITAGSTWHFQAWFRDQPATWNFSDAMTVEFCD